MTEATRNKIIKFRVTPEEFSKAEQLALAQKTTVSELFRQRALEQRPERFVPIISRQSFLYLGQLNNSLKLIAQTIHTMNNSEQELPKIIEETRIFLKELHSKILKKQLIIENLDD